MSAFTIHLVGPADLDDLRAHCERHRAESGRGDIHFMPFDPDGPGGPRFFTAEKQLLPLDEPGWERWFCARDDESGRIVGHVNLKGDGLHTGLHRCELGIGIERPWRGQGLGVQLLRTAIDFTRAAGSLVWLDLRVFAHNTPARALYTRLGFMECGVLHDRFRIGTASIDDILMTLRVG